MPAQHCIQGRADRRNIASAPLILNRSPDPAPTTTKSSRLDGFCHPLHHGQIAIAGTFRTSTPRGFLPWLPGRFRTTAPVPSRAVAMGRRPKPFTKAAVQAPRAESPPASQPDLRLAVVAVAPKSYFYPLQFKTSKKPRDRVGNEKHHCLPGPIRSKRAVLGASSAPRASDACVVFLIAGASASSSTIASPSQGNDRPVILLFIGKGTSPNDVAALERILNDNHLDFATADSNQFNQTERISVRGTSVADRPRGNFEDIGNRLTATKSLTQKPALDQTAAFERENGRSALVAGTALHVKGFRTPARH